MFLRFKRIESEIPKMGVWRDGYLIAELSFTPSDYELSTPGRSLEL